MKKRVQKKANTCTKWAISHPYKTVAFTGFATFFFGFGAAALLNFYLIYTHNPFIAHLRSSLNYKSAIFGDGILLPVVNMLVASFLLSHHKFISKHLIRGAFLSGGVITAYFHITQAMQGLVNWAMPTPWHWNILGLWHACYMFSVCSFLSLFYLLVIKLAVKEKNFSKNAVIVSAGIAMFFLLLKLDYNTVNVKSALTSDITRTRQELTGVVENGNSYLRGLTPFPVSN